MRTLLAEQNDVPQQNGLHSLEVSNLALQDTGTNEKLGLRLETVLTFDRMLDEVGRHHQAAKQNQEMLPRPPHPTI